MRYRFGGLIFGGAYFRNFTVFLPLINFTHKVPDSQLKGIHFLESEQKYGMKCLYLTLRKLSKNAFKRKIKKTHSEILASEDCYIDLPEIVQKVKLNVFSS